MLVVVAADTISRTGRLVAQHARRRRHRVRMLSALDDAATVEGTARAADAIVLIPQRGDAERRAHTLISAAQRGAHVLLVSSFAVGYGAAHAFNRVTGALPGLLGAERALRSSGLPHTVVRATWLTDDPPRAHALSLSQDPRADGMLARADLAETLVAAIEQPAARATTFALFNEPGGPERDWQRWFARLTPDPPA